MDLTIFEQAEKTAAGTFEPGINILGLAQGMVGYATEDGMVTDEMAAGLLCIGSKLEIIIRLLKLILKVAARMFTYTRCQVDNLQI